MPHERTLTPRLLLALILTSKRWFTLVLIICRSPFVLVTLPLILLSRFPGPITDEDSVHPTLPRVDDEVCLPTSWKRSITDQRLPLFDRLLCGRSYKQHLPSTIPPPSSRRRRDALTLARIFSSPWSGTHYHHRTPALHAPWNPLDPHCCRAL
jgi:hypothetical protein